MEGEGNEFGGLGDKDGGVGVNGVGEVGLGEGGEELEWGMVEGGDLDKGDKIEFLNEGES